MKAEDILDALSFSDTVQKIDVIAMAEVPGKQALCSKASLKNDFTLHVTEAFERASEAIHRLNLL